MFTPKVTCASEVFGAATVRANAAVAMAANLRKRIVRTNLSLIVDRFVLELERALHRVEETEG